MKFTKYFSGVIKHQGIPNIEVQEYQKLFNIISLENRIDELYRLKDKAGRNGSAYKYDLRIHDLTSQLNRLTMENTPENVLKYMVSQSHFD